MADPLTSDLQSLKIDREQRERSPRGRGLVKLLVWLLVLGGLGAVGTFAYPHLEAQFFRTPVRVTTVGSTSPAQAATSVTATGYVEPRFLSRVAAKTLGRVAQVHVREGQKVAKDDVLLSLDAVDQNSAIAAARARALAAEARAATARANVAEIETQIARERVLVSSGAQSRATLENLEARGKSLEASAAAAEAEAKAADAEVHVLRVGASQLVVRSPLTGTVLNEPPEPGDIVGPIPTGEEQGVIEIADLETVEVEVDVPETRMHLVSVGNPCQIVLDAFPGKTYEGAVSEIGRRVNRAKATVPVKVAFTGAHEGVLPDMARRVAFLTQALTAEAKQEAEKRVVPAAAVVRRSGRTFVFELVDEKVRERPVRLGARIGSDYELLSGPDVGTRVVSRPAATLRSGLAVKEVTEE